jgi:hypothetical protein
MIILSVATSKRFTHLVQPFLGTSRMQTYLILDEKLDTLDGGCGGLRDSGGNTTHCDKLSVKSTLWPKMTFALPNDFHKAKY